MLGSSVWWPVKCGIIDIKLSYLLKYYLKYIVKEINKLFLAVEAQK
jgi:hypothetical protein